MNGGDRIARVLQAQGVPFLFTLCGGHIAPILVGCKQRGIRVIDTRHEATAVFAADAVARLSGVPGVAAVTAGPGVTNTITALKNAQMAQSSMVVIGGAAPTALKGRGALQDIEQLAVIRTVVKWSRAVRRVRELVPAMETAFRKAQEGVPGPVFVEIPIDLLYDEELVRGWYRGSTGGKSLADRVIRSYLARHTNRLFAGAGSLQVAPQYETVVPDPAPGRLGKAAALIRRAERPLILAGSQTVLRPTELGKIVKALERMGLPVYLSGMARGLLGKGHALQMRHKRRLALKEADSVILAGVPCDFRLDYGRHIRRGASFVSANLSPVDLVKNRRPNVGLRCDPGRFLQQLAELVPNEQRHTEWRDRLRERDEARNEEIGRQAQAATEFINPLLLHQELEKFLEPETVLVADGGDFVGTASYILNPPGPLTWLDPGPFGTLGVGAGFALGAALCRPQSEVWIIYGDGSCGYSLAEFDTFARHGLPVIALVGNDAGWTQIAREQEEILKDDVGTVLARTDYHTVAAGFGGKGFLLDDPGKIAEVFAGARQAARDGMPVLINAMIGRTAFRKGSISM